MSMTAGDIDFDSVFLSGMSESVPFLGLSQLTWILFIIIMPILFTNMLVSDYNDSY